MCVNCWERAGSPTTWNEHVARAVELLGELYAINAVGGPLHVEVDDYNLDGQITPFYAGWTDADLDALYVDGWALADMPPGAVVVAEGEGRSLRQICDELAAVLNAMPVEDRYAAVAHRGGYWQPSPDRA